MKDRATYNSGALVLKLLYDKNRTNEENRSRRQHRKHECSVEAHVPETGEQGDNGLRK